MGSSTTPYFLSKRNHHTTHKRHKCSSHLLSLTLVLLSRARLLTMARSTATITLFVLLCLLVLTTLNVSVTGENTSLMEMKEEGHLDAAASRLRRGTASGGGAGAGAAGGGASGGGSGSTGTGGTRGYKNKVPRKNGASAAFAPSALILLGSLFLYFEGSLFSLLSS